MAKTAPTQEGVVRQPAGAAREAAERAALELAARYAGAFPSCDQTIRAVGVACYLRGHADASASLRELQTAAARSLAANAAWAKARLTRELVTYPATSDAFIAAQREKDEADAKLAALLPADLPVPAEGAKGGG